MIADSAPWLPAVAPFFLAGSVTMVSIPFTMWLARWSGAVDRPDEERRIHKQPTPRLGGIALYFGFAVALSVFGNNVPNRAAVLIATGLITSVMAADDILHLSPRLKFAITVSAGFLVAGMGITITVVSLPGNHVIELAWFSVPVTIAYLVGMQTAINFLDGVDGVAAGVVAVVAGALLLAAINRIDLVPGQPNLFGDVIRMSGALIGCCVGFLFFNFHPARVFMGDCGAHFLGLALGAITVLGTAKAVVAFSLGIPLLALALPIGDTAFAIVRRRRAGRGIAQADAGHLHHRLIARGLSVRETAVAFYLGTAILGCIGLALFGHKKVLGAAVLLLLVALLGMLMRNRKRRPPRPVPEPAPINTNADSQWHQP